jgi:hypothetical protein
VPPGKEQRRRFASRPDRERDPKAYSAPTDLRAAIEGAGLVDCAVQPLGLGLLARHHRGGFRVYQVAHAIINRVESTVHEAMPPNRPYPSQYWMVKARLPARAPQ